ncbi:DUF3810 domain-containing protein [Pedobacter boryungensis]|uniref:DUF3810 domain-containing protein n=1 Tax=Pedobacter boryungensis TaxID=869962 RepID=A0ABX2D8A5_9SPHI|nr:DUF3810 domain-containing protein [Pedobacter boryungensis]NQX30286.1 DUF3810 domain-containing protein [Pedobacter boryungensis]
MQTIIPRSLLVKSTIIFGLALLIYILGLFPQLVLNIYSNGLYPIFSSVLRWISSIFPFALGDILYGLLIVFALIQVFLFFKRRKSLSKSHRLIIPLKLFNLFLILYISFKLLWGLNYARPSITQKLTISDEKYNVKELVILGNYFIDKLNTLQPQLSPKLSYDINELRKKAVIEYQHMEIQNSFFHYNAPSIKPVLNDWMVSKIGIEGYYNPLSGEANINMKLPAWVLPFVACHEISHQMGVAREDEANLVAYLVGVNSNDVNFQYSVNYNMLRYILFEIRMKSPEDYLKMRDKISPEVLANFKAENEFWAKYNGQMSSYMGVAFDKFLKLNNQKRGIKSYQNIVIWLWNIHKKELSASN